MGTTATAIAVTYSIVVVVGLILAIAIWRSTRGVDPKEFDEKKAAEREKTWLAIVIAFLISTLLGTILLVPYGESAGPDGQVVKVVARQFGFQISPSTVTAGRSVEFQLTSADTTHGFGVTTIDNTLLFQAQIAPEHTQEVVYTFQTPGTYKVVCFEFCGVGHHAMLAEITVEQ
jgi:cytochrome c oxidase subunit 2